MKGPRGPIGGEKALFAAATAVRWRIVALLMAGSFLSWFNRVSISVAGTERLMKQYGLSATEMGLVYSALLLTYALFMTPGGFFLDAKGAWTALVLMSVGSGLCVLATGLVGWLFVSAAGVWLALVVIRAFAGVFMAPIYPASGRIIAHWLPPSQRAWANGLVTGAAPAGIACTYLGFGSLLDWLDWPGAFLVSGFVTMLLGLVWMRYGRDYPEQHAGVNGAELRLIGEGRSLPARRAGDHRRSPWQRLLRNRSLLLLTLSYSSINYFEYLFFFWTQYYFDDVLQWGQDASRLYSTVLYLAMAVGMGLGGLLSDGLRRAWGPRWGRAAVPLGGMSSSAVLLFVGIRVGEPALLVACFALALAAVGTCEGPCWATAIELGGRRSGAAAALVNTGGNFGGLLAPTLTPWISSRFGWSWGLLLSSIACLLGAVLWLGIDARERVREHDEGPSAPS